MILKDPHSKIVVTPRELHDYQQQLAKGMQQGKESSDDPEKKIQRSEEIPRIVDQQSRCLSCWQKVDSDRMYEISYRMIINHHYQKSSKKKDQQFLSASKKATVNILDPKNSEIQ